MMGKLFTVSAAASLALCLAIGVVWVRSHYGTDRVVWRREQGSWSVTSAEGHLVVGANLRDRSGQPADHYGLSYSRDEAAPWAEFVLGMLELNVDPGDTWIQWDHAGFAWYEWQARGGGSLIARGVAPFWSVIVLTAVLPMAWTAVRLRGRVRARRRKRSCLCPACGYDLRASPGRCPECGTAPAKAVA